MENRIVNKKLVLKAEDIVTIGMDIYSDRGTNKKRYESNDGFYSDGFIAIKQGIVEDWDKEFCEPNKINGWAIDKKQENKKIKDVEEKGNIVKVTDCDGNISIFSARFYRFLKANLDGATIEINLKEMSLYFKNDEELVGMMLGIRVSKDEKAETTFEEDITIEELLSEIDDIEKEETKSKERLKNFIEEKIEEVIAIADKKIRRYSEEVKITMYKDNEESYLVAETDGDIVAEEKISNLGPMDLKTSEEIAKKAIKRMSNENTKKHDEGQYQRYSHISPNGEKLLELINDPSKNKKEIATNLELRDFLMKENIAYSNIKNRLERKEKPITITSIGECAILSKKEMENLAVYNNLSRRKEVVDSINEYYDWIKDKTYIKQGLTLDETYGAILKLLGLLAKRNKIDNLEDEEVLTKIAFNGYKRLVRFKKDKDVVINILENVALGITEYKLIK